MIEQKTPKKRTNFFAMFIFFILVFAVAIGGTFVGLQLFAEEANSNSNSNGIPNVVTVEVVITTTPNPLPEVIVVTATGQATQVELPDDLPISSSTPVIIEATATLDTESLETPSVETTDVTAEAQVVEASVTPTTNNCITHILVEGDTPFGVAEQYGANPFLLLEANNLDDESSSLLQIGDEMIVPLEGCQLDTLSIDEPTPTETNTPESLEPTTTPEATAEVAQAAEETASPVAPPIITLAPTATNAQIEFVSVDGIGDITAEGIRLRNNGNTIDVTGWTLKNGEDNVFSFPEQLLFSNAEVTIYTRSGTNTPVALFWGLDEPIWAGGDVLTLINATGEVQATIQIPETSG